LAFWAWEAPEPRVALMVNSLALHDLKGSRIPIASCHPAVLVNEATEHVPSLDPRSDNPPGPCSLAGGDREGCSYPNQGPDLHCSARWGELSLEARYLVTGSPARGLNLESEALNSSSRTRWMHNWRGVAYQRALRLAQRAGLSSTQAPKPEYGHCSRLRPGRLRPHPRCVSGLKLVRRSSGSSPFLIVASGA
jgi:hypothetical protein